MKTNQLFLPFLIFTISFNSFLSSAAEAPPAVIDIAGKKLRTGVDYYILPVVRGRGGGLTLDSTGNESCPLDAVVQEHHEIKNGLPLTFTPVNPKKGVIRESTDLNIKFSAASICVQTTLWKLDDFDEATGKYFITIGGNEGNPGRETISNWFKIDKFERDYKLVYCPTVCNFCKVICKDVGIFIQDGTRRLALSDVPFKVMFKKA
ncbi:kunitz trypsin inhibitor 5-like [Nicotiana tabacum]|uniref:Kunitz trypsin inhibitor 5-like n=1 Tax=Nicotiana tabacum TaxID=4097 RepID=A0A1S4DGM7_TOBAC|nr:PREDICTED: miraculin-like [Nicotiana tabacum]